MQHSDTLKPARPTQNNPELDPNDDHQELQPRLEGAEYRHGV